MEGIIYNKIDILENELWRNIQMSWKYFCAIILRIKISFGLLIIISNLVADTNMILQFYTD
jgi:hypothetical protein